MPMRTKLLRGLFISLLLLLVKKVFLWAWMYLPGQFFLLGGYPTEFQSREKRRNREKIRILNFYFDLLDLSKKYDFLFLPDSAIALSFFYSTFFAKKRKKSFCTIFQVAVNQLETLLNEMEKYFLAQKDIRGNLSNASLKRKDKKWFKSLLIKSCFCLKVANAHLMGYL